MLLCIMKFNTDPHGCCNSICTWVLVLITYQSFAKRKKRMDGAVKPALLPTASLCDISVKQEDGNGSDSTEAVTSPNMSTDSGFEGEINKTFMQNSLPSPTDSSKMNAWEAEALTDGDLENADELALSHSPRKSIEDSDFNESPFEKKSVPSAGDTDGESNDIAPVLDEDSFHIVPLWGEEEGACAMMRNGYVVKDVSPSDMVLVAKKADDCDDGNLCVSAEGVPEYPSTDADVNCWYYECANGECLWPDSSDYPNNQNGSPSEELRDIAVLESNDDNCSFSCSYSSDSGDTLDAKKLSVEDSSQLSVTLMDVGDTDKNRELLVPVRPPRKMRCAKICREETQSDEDVAVITMSPQFPVYKSSRSQSEPSHYTTVLKPKAIKPPAINLDRTVYRSSIESLHGGHVAASFSNYHNRESAFRERPRSSLGQVMEVHLPFRLVETPPPALISRNSVHQSLANNAFSSIDNSNMPSTSIQLPSQRAHSLNNVSCSHSPNATSDGVLKTSHSKSTPLSGKRKIATSMSNSSQCSSDGDDREEGAVGGARSGTAHIKRHSMPWDLIWNTTVLRRPANDRSAKEEPIHMTLEEVRSSLQTCSSPTAQSDDDNATKSEQLPGAKTACKRSLGTYLRRRKGPRDGKASSNPARKSEGDRSHRTSLPSSIRAVLANIFGSKKNQQQETDGQGSQQKQSEDSSQNSKTKTTNSTSPFTNRALPPLPNRRIEGVGDHLLLSSYFQSSENEILTLCEEDYKLEEEARRKRKMDYAASITRVKDCGWYWGPISGEMAEKLLANEPDGSFVVRDSSDEHYIFSLTFKLNGLVRHVRIEHDHGNFSFGCLQKFRSNTIVDFIENAVQHSRSGRYLFFLHRRPVLGPMRVQLLHPVSRFKQVQSLQHLCRFVILKTVRRDLISELPLPRRLKDYLNTPHYYSEQLPSLSSTQNAAAGREVATSSSSSSSSQMRRRFTRHEDDPDPDPAPARDPSSDRTTRDPPTPPSPTRFQDRNVSG